MPNFYWCLAPACGSGQVHDAIENGNSMMICNACGAATCVTHNVPWHGGQTCHQYERAHQTGSAAREAAIHTEGLRSLGFQDCPGCGVTVEKTAGCDHITCQLIPPTHFFSICISSLA